MGGLPPSEDLSGLRYNEDVVSHGVEKGGLLHTGQLYQLWQGKDLPGEASGMTWIGRSNSKLSGNDCVDPPGENPATFVENSNVSRSRDNLDEMGGRVPEQGGNREVRTLWHT